MAAVKSAPGARPDQVVQTSGSGAPARAAWYGAVLPAATSTPDSADANKTALIEHLRAIATAPPEKWTDATRTWLQQAFSAYLARTVATMDEALQLNGEPSQRSFITCAAYEERNRYLVIAGEELGGRPWPRARQLAAEVAKFEDAYWPTWSALAVAPRDATPLRAALFQAFKAAPEVPHGIAQLNNILTGKT